MQSDREPLLLRSGANLLKMRDDRTRENLLDLPPWKLKIAVSAVRLRPRAPFPPSRFGAFAVAWRAGFDRSSRTRAVQRDRKQRDQGRGWVLHTPRSKLLLTTRAIEAPSSLRWQIIGDRYTGTRGSFDLTTRLLLEGLRAGRGLVTLGASRQ